MADEEKTVDGYLPDLRDIGVIFLVVLVCLILSNRVTWFGKIIGGAQ
jgi:hypothetical protein